MTTYQRCAGLRKARGRSVQFDNCLGSGRREKGGDVIEGGTKKVHSHGEFQKIGYGG